jgi:hypothetical protein
LGEHRSFVACIAGTNALGVDDRYLGKGAFFTQKGEGIFPDSASECTGAGSQNGLRNF